MLDATLPIVTDLVRDAAHPLTGAGADYDPLLEFIGDADVLDFIGWLRSYNDSLPPDALKTGFYGLDPYSLHASIEAVLNYLDKVDPEGAQRARHRYACFEHFGQDPQKYGYAAGFGLSRTCESEVIAQLIDLQRRAREYALRDGRVAADDFFYAEQNARLVKNAEQYYRTVFRG